MTATTMPRVRSRLVVRIACGLALVSGVACGGGGGGPGPAPTPTGSSGALPPTQVQVQARGCHTTRTGEVDIQLSFDLPARASLGGYAGALQFHAQLVDPTSWTTVAAKPHLIDRPNSEIFHLVVPEGEPIPPTLVLRPSAEAVEAQATAQAGSPGDLAGQRVETPFGEATVASVRATSDGTELTVSGPNQGLGSGVASEGPEEATLAVGSRSVEGQATLGDTGSTIRFPTPSDASGATTLTLNGWAFALRPDVTLTVPVGSCTAG